MTENKFIPRLLDPSADSQLSRQEFITKILKGAALTGGLISAPVILDKFLVPKAYANASSSTGVCTAGDTTTSNGKSDSVSVQTDNNNDFSVVCAGFGEGGVPGNTRNTNVSNHDTACNAGNDFGLSC